MNKTVKIVLIIVSSVIATIATIAAIALGLYFLRKVPDTKVEVSGNIVDNDYNNYLAGSDLVRIGDKLYFNYYHSNHCYGLIEISENGSERIYWDGDVWLGCPAVFNNPLRKWNGQLYMRLDDGVYLYSEETKQFEKDEYLSQFANENPYVDLTFQMVGGTLVYVHYDSSTATSTAYSYDGKTHRTLLSKEGTSVYIDGTKLYYCSRIFVSYGKWMNEICVYNLTDGSDTLIYTVPEEYFRTSRIWVESGHILFTARYDVSGQDVDGLFKIDLGSPNPSIEQICNGESISLNNVYDGRVYVTVDSKLYSFDVVSHDAIKLSDRNVMHCFIVDDKWVYLEEYQSDYLWRVSQSGSGEEKVYG